ncbi:tRNA 2-selenouridine(34) synthase MnmH [Lutibacter sp. B2]|nr:tRNA 2-selenouridine(34) synthase MnmH [Lutibacter sp. B2]
MMKVMTIEQALNKEKVLFIDVRSQSEFEDGTIKGAINIPILDDEERALVGTIYKKESVDKATTEGLKYASSKLAKIYEKIKEYASIYDEIVIFCWRGGMRSSSLCTIINMLKVENVYKLEDGYKSYRSYTMNFFKNCMDDYKFIMIHGLTGVGKTHILEKLKDAGKSILNLEEIANNSGSVFGNIVFNGITPSQKMFETYIFHSLYDSKEKYIFVESESKRVGHVQIPNEVYEKILSGYHILTNTTIQKRVDIILKDYIKEELNQISKIKESINHLRKRLGHKEVDLLLEKIDHKEYRYVVEYLINKYYDPLYKHSISKYEPYDLIVNYECMDEAVMNMVVFLDNIQQ